tara:strand:- start:10210 stop:16359 length:6150 start_codon:yes stop_codon:yes gene_type:complete
MQAHSLEQVQTAIRNAQAAGDARAVAALKDYEEDIKRDIAMLRALAPREEAGVVENITSGIGAGAVGTGEIALLGGATLLEEEAELAAREKIKAGIAAIRPEGGDPDSISYQVGQALGSAGAFFALPVAGALVGAPGAAVATGVGALGLAAARGEASERARAAGATEEERERAINDPRIIAAGLLEIIPVARAVKFADLPALNKLLEKIPPEKIETFGERIQSAGVTGSAEALQEAGSNILQNLTEQEYNAAAETFAGTAEEAALGGTAGAIIQGFIDLFAPRKRGVTIGEAAQKESDDPEIAGLLEFKPEQPTQLDLLGVPKAPELDIEEIRTKVEGGYKKPFAELTDKQKESRLESIAKRVQKLPPEERALYERSLEEPEAPIREEVSPDQMVIPGLEPESTVGPQLQRLLAPEADTVAGETLALTPEGQALTREEVLDRINRRDRERRITEEPVSDEARLGQQRAAIAAEDQPDLFPTELAKARQEARLTATESADVETAPDPVVATEEALNSLSIPAKDPVRQKLLDKDLRETEQQDILTKYAARRSTSGKAKSAINRFLKGTPEAQLELVTPTGRRPRVTEEVATPTLIQRTRKKIAARAKPTEEVTAEPATRRVTTAPTVRKPPARPPVDAETLAELERQSAERTDPIIAEAAKEKREIGDQYRKDLREMKKRVRKSVPSIEPRKREIAARTEELSKQYEEKIKAVNTRTNEAFKQQRERERVARNEELERKSRERVAARTQRAPETEVEAETTEAVTLNDLSKEERAARNTEFTKLVADKKKEGLTQKQAVEAARDEQAINDQDNLLGASNIAYNAIDAPIPDAALRAAKKGELRRALLEIAETVDDPTTKKIARTLANYTFTTKISVRPSRSIMGKSPVTGEVVPLDGAFNPKTNEILLDEESGTSVGILLHEMTHAATDNVLENKSHPNTKKLQRLYDEVKEQLGDAYGATNLKEFVAEAFTNAKFQNDLAKISPKGKQLTFWENLLQILSDFLGIQRFDRSARGKAFRRIQEILAPAPEFRYGPLLAASGRPDDVRRIFEEIKGQKAGFRTAEGRATARKKLSKEINALLTDPQVGTKKYLTKIFGFLPNGSIQDIAEARGIPNAKRILDAIETQRGRLTEAEQVTRQTLEPVFRWASKASQETMKTFNNLVYESTINEVDPNLTPAEAKKKYGDQTVEGTSQRKIDKYNELRTLFQSAEMGPDGRRAYEELRGFYRDQYNALIDSLRGRLDDLPVGETTRTNLKNELLAKLLENTGKEPYFPLTRSGSYWLAVRQKEGDRSNAAVFAFNTPGERLAAMESYEKQGFEVDSWDNSKSSSYRNPPPGSFVSDVLKILDLTDKNVDPTIKEQITRLFIEELPESSFAKALIKRKNTEGYDMDAVDAARTKAFDLARQTERIKNSNAISRELDQMLEQVEAQGLGRDSARDAQLIEELRSRAQFAIQPTVEGYPKHLNRLAFIYTIGFNASSALVNLSQIPLFALPMLSGKYGAKQATNAVKNSTLLFQGAPMNKASRTLYGDIRTPDSIKQKLAEDGLYGTLQDMSLKSLDNYYTFTRDPNSGDLLFSVREDLELPKDKITELEELAPLIQLASRRGHLNSSFLADTLSIDGAGRKMSRYDAMTNASALMFHQAELMNRQVTMVTAYKLELDKLTNGDPSKATAEQRKEAADKALHETQLINGGATLETGPRLAREGVMRVALMYKNYGIQMYYAMGKTGYEAVKVYADSYRKDLESKGMAKSAIDALVKTAKSEAFKQLAGVHLSALLLAGVQGLPLYGAVSALYDGFTDDYEEDFDTFVRSSLNNEAIYRGIPTELLGIDVSERIKLTDLLVEANRFASDPSPAETFMHYVGGPAWSVLSRAIGGAEKMIKAETGRDLVRGFEDLLPGAVRNVYQGAIRYPMEGGIRNRRGDYIYDDMSAGELAVKILGFPPAEYTRSEAEKRAVKNIETAATRERGRLLNSYYVATRFGEFDEKRRIRRKMNEFNASDAVRINPKLRIDDEVIERSLESHKRTTKAKMYNGVTLSKGAQDLIDDVGFF